MFTDTFNFVPGKKYRIRSRIGMQRITREHVMVYLGSSGAMDLLGFSARPVAGTQQLECKHILHAVEVPFDTVVYINKKVV